LTNFPGSEEKRMAKEPTQKQRAVFDFVCEAIRREGRPPTVREVADHFGYASPKAASDHLAALERKGYLSRPERKSRNIHIAEGLDPRGIPVVRDIEPDTPVLTLGKVEESLSLNTLFEVDQKTVAVRMKDDSMKDAGINSGDYVIVEADGEVEEGCIAAVQVEDEIAVGRVSFEGRDVRLSPEDDSAEETQARLDSEDTIIIGPVRGVVREFPE